MTEVVPPEESAVVTDWFPSGCSQSASSASTVPSEDPSCVEDILACCPSGSFSPHCVKNAHEKLSLLTSQNGAFWKYWTKKETSPYPKHQQQEISDKTSRLSLSPDTLAPEPAFQHMKAAASLVQQIQDFPLAAREDTNSWPTPRGAMVGTVSYP